MPSKVFRWPESWSPPADLSKLSAIYGLLAADGSIDLIGVEPDP